MPDAWSQAARPGGRHGGEGETPGRQRPKGAEMPRYGLDNWNAAWSRALSDGPADSGPSDDTWVAQEMEHGVTGPDARSVAPTAITAPTQMDHEEEEDLGGGMIAVSAPDLLLDKTPSPGGPIPIPYPNSDAPDAPEDAPAYADFGAFG